jgi:hypothetical protein
MPTASSHHQVDGKLGFVVKIPAIDLIEVVAVNIGFTI